jgi:O-antigen ligase
MRYLLFGLICLIAFTSVDTFNTQLTGMTDDQVVQQGGDIRWQVAAVGLWIVLLIVSFLPGMSRSRPITKGLVWPALLLGWVVVSPLWGDYPENGVAKALAFLLSSLAAWRMASVVTAKEMLACTFYTLLALLALSLLLAVGMPEIGLLKHDWQHEGQWKGMFATKQGLGAVSAVFLVLAFLRLSHRRNAFNLAACALGLSCLLGSGSRGGGVMAVVAVASLIVVRRSPKFTPLVTGILLLGLILGVLEIAYFSVTGDSSIQIFGSDINLTERTFIWQYAMSLWVDRPYLGFGLNGFWTSTDILSRYLNLHGWVLDNYHSGYLAIAVETGLIGLVLFSAMSFKLAPRLRFLLLHARSNRLSLEMTVGYAIMFFTINLTETYFLRSTNFMAVLFTFLIIKTLAVPEPSRVQAPVEAEARNPKLVRIRSWAVAG